MEEGFTLIEVLLSVSLLAILAVAAFVFLPYMNAGQENEIMYKSATFELQAALEIDQQKLMTGHYDITDLRPYERDIVIENTKGTPKTLHLRRSQIVVTPDLAFYTISGDISFADYNNRIRTIKLTATAPKRDG